MRHAFLIGIILFGLNNLYQLAPAQNKNRLNKLNNAIDRMELSGREMSNAELNLAIQKSENLLSDAGKEFMPTILFQLSELYIRKARNDFRRSMEEYEEKYKKFKNKEISIEPVLPRINFGNAIKYMYELLDNYGYVRFIDKVLYRLALCHQEEENTEKSVQYYKRLIAAVPLSNLVPESYFRLGEHYFSKGKFEDAISYYEKLIAPEMWSSSFYDMSLYKLGWANYNINHYPDAISYFLTLLKDIDVLQRIQPQKLDRNAADLKQEAITYVAVCFVDFGDPESTFQFLNSKLENELYRNQILSQLGDIYLKQDRLDEAVQTFILLLKNFPLHPDAPFYVQKIIDAYYKKWDLTAANEERGVLINNFNQESSWYQSQSDSLVQVRALNLVKDALYQKGIYHQMQARTTEQNGFDYNLAIQQYNYFLTSFPDDSIAYKVRFNLADCYYALKQFESAAEEYKKVYTIYPRNGYSMDAAYSSVLSYYQASNLYKTINPQKFTLDGFYGLEGNVTIEVGNPATQQFILACNDVLKIIPNDPRVVDIFMKEAEVLNEINRFDLARRIYFKVVQDYPHHPQFARAATLIAQSYFQEEDYEQAEKWYNTVVTMLPDTMDLVKRAKVRMASSHYKLAEKSKKAGNLKTAAEEFATAATQYPRSQIAEQSLVEAGNVMLALGDTAKAALIFENFIEKYPNSRLMEMCVLRAARFRENVEQWDKAAENYLKLRNTNSPNRNLAIFTAGVCYSKAKMWRKAIDVFDEYIKFAHDPDKLLQAYCKTGLAYYEMDVFKKAENAFNKTNQYYNSIKGKQSVNTYFVAQAQFMLGEISYIRYAGIDLTLPFKESLMRKSNAMRTVLKNYAAAAKYRIGEWTTSSSYKIGKTFEDFANAIITSQVPSGLNEEQTLEYENQLKITARPFQKKAMLAYQSNLKQAQKNSIKNTWITLSKSRISMLSQVLKDEE